MPGPIKVELRRESSPNKARVDILGPGGEADGRSFDLPWLDEMEWLAVFRSLELQEEDQTTWPQGEVREKAAALRLFLPEQDRPSNDRWKIIGQTLYSTVFDREEIGKLLDRLLHTSSETPILEFHIPDEGSILQAYPWELLHDDKGFLFDGTRAIPVRHVNFPERIAPLNLAGRLKVLYVAPRPDMLSAIGHFNLPLLERPHLEYLNRYYPDHIVLESPSSNTLDALQKYLIGTISPVHIVHIDTHGDYGWLCGCGRLNPPSANQCSCGRIRSADQTNRGYIAFEDADGRVTWANGDDLIQRLHGKGISIVVLSACRSGLVGGASTFNSVAGALVKERTPAVVAMQFSISFKQASKFVEFFYWALINGMPLTQAMTEARAALAKDWYRPVLYLRTDSSNYQGKIFEYKSPSSPPKRLSPREKWIAQLGFRRDPFLHQKGERDPYLQEYFYFDMRNFDKIYDVPRPSTTFVFGPAGSGKSSMRNVISQLCRKDKIFPVVYQDLGKLARKSERGEKVQIEDHVAQILQTALRSLSDMAAELAKEDISAHETDASKINRNQLWLYVLKYEKDPRQVHTLQNLLKPDAKVEAELPEDPRELLGRFCRDVTELFGYQFVYLLVDPNDDIARDENVAWEVLEPLLWPRRLLELYEDKVAFKFFLSEKFRERARRIPWIEQEWDQRAYSLEWPNEELGKLLEVRLKECSDRRFVSLAAVTEVSELDKGSGDLDQSVIALSAQSPRRLIVICDRLFSEHCRRWSAEDGEPLLLTAQEVNNVLQMYQLSHPKSPEEQRLEQLLEQWESDKIEFKSTMRYNRRAGKADKEMEKQVAKTICAFMNTEGGTLIIGADDDKVILGLEDDFSTLGRGQKRDAFERAFTDITENLFKPPILPDYYKANFLPYHDHLVYVVEVKKSEKPVFCLFDGKTEFYIRKQNSTRKLESDELIEYFSTHFNRQASGQS